MAWSPFLAALALVIAPPAPPQDGLHVGFGAADITPDLGRHVAWMAGYRNDYRATGVHDALWARAVVLDDGLVGVVGGRTRAVDGPRRGPGRPGVAMGSWADGSRSVAALPRWSFSRVPTPRSP